MAQAGSVTTQSGDGATPAVADYFPLQPGNTWIYQERLSGNRIAETVVRVGQPRTINGVSYMPVTGFRPGEFLLRSDGAALWQYDAASARERLWYNFSVAPGESYDSGLPPCCSRAQVTSLADTYEGPLGSFNNALTLAYTTTTPNSVQREQFLPYVGLLSRTESAGSLLRTWDLVYARLGGVTVLGGPEVQFSLALPKTTFAPNEEIPFRWNLFVRQPAPLLLNFPSGQTFDAHVRNQAGETLWTWSATRLFPAIARREEWQGDNTFADRVPALSLPTGNYLLEVYLVPSGGRSYSAQVPFSVAAPR